MSASSSSSAGCIITAFGSGLKKDMSKSPWWVAPSLGLSPARSRQKVTGSFWRQTSCMAQS